VNWVLDADFREFFTSLDHQWLARFLEHRIADGRVQLKTMACTGPGAMA
jgi:RNA-directed DNA polymerase